MSVQTDTLTQFAARANDVPTLLSVPLEHDDGGETLVHIMVIPRSSFQLRVALMPSAERLLHWCKRMDVRHAMSGGFFLRTAKQPLGETWMGGVRVESMPWGAHWADKRGALFSDGNELKIASLGEMPKKPRGDLITAGPALLREGKMLVHPEAEFEGIPETWEKELDDNWTKWRAARIAIGCDKRRIWAVASDGPVTDPVWAEEVGVTSPDAGLYLWEMAQILQALGATEALNLDGGGGATLIYNKRLINRPLAGKYDDTAPGVTLPEGRPIHTALTFVPQ